MLSQSKAWSLLAGIWKKPIPAPRNGWSDRVECVVMIGDDMYAGLCNCIEKLFDTKQIKETVKSRMLGAVGLCGGFLWEPTFAGAKQRVRFCQIMSKRTKRKKKLPAMAI